MHGGEGQCSVMERSSSDPDSNRNGSDLSLWLQLGRSRRASQGSLILAIVLRIQQQQKQCRGITKGKARQRCQELNKPRGRRPKHFLYVYVYNYILDLA